jgi:hypothetical protein
MLNLTRFPKYLKTTYPLEGEIAPLEEIPEPEPSYPSLMELPPIVLKETVPVKKKPKKKRKTVRKSNET